MLKNVTAGAPYYRERLMILSNERLTTFLTATLHCMLSNLSVVRCTTLKRRVNFTENAVFLTTEMPAISTGAAEICPQGFEICPQDEICPQR